MPHRDWIDYLEAFGPLIAAVVALIVGFTQLLLQRKQLKEELFEKRWKVYSGVQEYLASLLRDDGGNDPSASYRQFRLDTDPGEFLFGDAVWEYIKNIGDTGTRFRFAQARAKAHGTAVQAPISPINPDGQQWLNNELGKLEQARQEEEELTPLILRAFEGGAKGMFAKDLRLERSAPR